MDIRLIIAGGVKQIENPSDPNGIVFSTGASGPSFGHVQLDSGLSNRPGYNVINKIMASSGFDAQTINAVNFASWYVSSIKSESAPQVEAVAPGLDSKSLALALTKKVEFIKATGAALFPDGSFLSQVHIGENVLSRLNEAIYNNSYYINSISSTQIDTVSGKVSSVIQELQSRNISLGLLPEHAGVLYPGNALYKEAVVALGELYNFSPLAFSTASKSLYGRVGTTITIDDLYASIGDKIATDRWKSKIRAAANGDLERYSSWYISEELRVNEPTMSIPVGGLGALFDDTGFYDFLESSTDGITSIDEVGDGGYAVRYGDSYGLAYSADGTPTDTIVYGSDSTVYTSLDALTTRTLWTDGFQTIEHVGANPYTETALPGGGLRIYGNGDDQPYQTVFRDANGNEFQLDMSADDTYWMVNSQTRTAVPISAADYDPSTLSRYAEALSADSGMPDFPEAYQGVTIDVSDGAGGAFDAAGVGAAPVGAVNAVDATAYMQWVNQRANDSWAAGRANEIGAYRGDTSALALASNPGLLAIYDATLAYGSVRGALAQPSTASILLALKSTVTAAVTLGRALDDGFLQNTARQLGIQDDFGANPGDIGPPSVENPRFAGQKLGDWVADGGATLATLASISIATEDPSIRNVAGAVHSAIGLGMRFSQDFTLDIAEGLQIYDPSKIVGKDLAEVTRIQGEALDTMGDLMAGAGAAVTVTVH
ncbi:MAG: hypothetical protein HQL42_15875 [Alphaproteobacteria bacterium]|nr:hypothetical protein [Alphaproteobacteria bacterium]